MLAASVGIQTGLKGQIGAAVAGDDGAGVIDEELRRHPLRGLTRIILDMKLREALIRVHGSAATSGSSCIRIGHDADRTSESEHENDKSGSFHIAA
jgi:hypothetical protein